MDMFKRRRDVLTLGAKGEVYYYDFTHMGWDAELMMEKLHTYAYAAMTDRDIHDVYVWSGRVCSMFAYNGLSKIGHILNMSESKVFTLHGCGLVVRKEVYHVFKNELGITLLSWNPVRWYQKYRTYRFDDEDE